MRRARLDRRLAQGHARRARARALVGRAPAGRPARRAGARSSTSARTKARAPQRAHHPPIAPDEYEKAELLRLEKETLGLYVSEHPLDAVRDQLRRKTRRRRSPSSSAAATARSSTVGGIVSTVKQLTTKKGDPMVFLRLDDLTGERRGRRLQLGLRGRHASCCETDRMLVVKGRVDHKQEGETKLIAIEVTRVRAQPPGGGGALEGGRARALRPASCASSRTSSATSRARRRSCSRSRRRTGRGRSSSGPATALRPVPDFFAEVKALLGEAAVS